MKYIAMMLIMLFSTGNIVLAGDINTTVDTEKQAVFKEEKKKSSKKKKEKVVEEVAIEASVEATTPDVEEKVVAKPLFTSPQNGATISSKTNDTVIITGSSHPQIKQIIVNNYTLLLYKPGDTKWTYYASIAANTLKKGLNTYVVKGVDNEGKETDVSTLQFNYIIEEPLVVNTVVEHVITPLVEEKVVATEEKKTTKKKDSDAYPAAQDDLSDTLYGNTRVIDNADIRATEGSKTVIVENGITPKDESYTIDDLLLEDDFIPYSSDETLLSTFSKEPSQWDSSAQFTPYRSNAEADIYNLGTSSGLINRYQIRAGYQKDYFINSQKKAAMRTAKLYNAYKNYGVSKRNAEDEATMNTAVVSQ